MTEPGPIDVAVVGSANMDLVARVARLPRPGETVPGAGYAEVPGGKGANQAVAAARMGASVGFVASLGADAFGDALFFGLETEGIDLRFVTRAASEPTGVAMIWVEDSGQNEIVVVPGANAVARNFLFVQAVEAAKVSLFQLEIPVEVVAEGLRVASGLTIFDPAPAIPLPEDFPWDRVLGAHAERDGGGGPGRHPPSGCRLLRGGRRCLSVAGRGDGGHHPRRTRLLLEERPRRGLRPALSDYRGRCHRRR